MTQLAHSFSSVQMFENCPLRYYYQRITKEVKDTGGTASIHGERVHKALERRIKFNEQLPQELSKLESSIVAIEKAAKNGSLVAELELTLNADLNPTGWWDNDAWLRSKLDVFIKVGNTAFVFDWKTGKRKPDPTQLELFALQVFANYKDVDVVHSAYIWTANNKMDKLTFQRGLSHVYWASLLMRTKRIEDAAAANVWPAKPSGLCRFCPANKICKYA